MGTSNASFLMRWIPGVLFFAAVVFILIAVITGLRLAFGQGGQNADDLKYALRAFLLNAVLFILLAWLFS